jgi:hypothetical protein
VSVDKKACSRLYQLIMLKAGFGKSSHFETLGGFVPNPCLTVGALITLRDGSPAVITQPLVDRILAKGLDKIHCKHVAAAIFWILRANECDSPAQAELLLSGAKTVASNHLHLLAELDVATRIVDLVFRDLASTDNFGDIFASWLVSLMPLDEALKIHRPWNSRGVPGNTYSNAEYTPLEFVPSAGGGAGGDALQGTLSSSIHPSIHSFRSFIDSFIDSFIH